MTTSGAAKEDKKNLVKRICGLCGADAFRRVPFHYRWEGRRFDGIRCRYCGLVTIDPLPSDADLERLYASEYFHDGHHGLERIGSDYETWTDGRIEATARFLTRTILPRNPRGRSLFELGAAMGHFLSVARDAGLTVGGVDISTHAVSRAREKFGIDLICGDLLEISDAELGGPWDIVYAGDVLEHLRRPCQVLERLHGIMSDDGLLVVRVPATLNTIATRLAEPLLRLLRRDKCLPDPPYHLYEFTERTLRALLAREFRRVEIVQEIVPPWRLNRKSGGVEYQLKAAMHWLNYPLTQLTGRWGDRLTGFARAGH